MALQNLDLNAIEQAITESQTPNGAPQDIFYDENTGNLNLTGGVKTTNMVKDGYAYSII